VIGPEVYQLRPSGSDDRPVRGARRVAAALQDRWPTTAAVRPRWRRRARRGLDKVTTAANHHRLADGLDRDHRRTAAWTNGELVAESAPRSAAPTSQRR
jgi:hypothetical protein